MHMFQRAFYTRPYPCPYYTASPQSWLRLPSVISPAQGRLRAATLAKKLSLRRLRIRGLSRRSCCRRLRRGLLLLLLRLLIATGCHTSGRLGQGRHSGCGLLCGRLLLDRHHLQTVGTQLGFMSAAPCSICYSEL